jgi:hypothetical protein
VRISKYVKHMQSPFHWVPLFFNLFFNLLYLLNKNVFLPTARRITFILCGFPQNINEAAMWYLHIVYIHLHTLEISHVRSK